MDKISIHTIKQEIVNLSSKKVLRNLFVVSGATLFVSIIAFVKETFIAANYGLDQELDTFLIAMLIPGFINTVFLGSYKSVFIPNYINESHAGGDTKGFQTTSFIITFLVSIFFIVFAILGTDTFLEFLFPDKSTNYYTLIKEQFYIIAPCIFLWGFGSLVEAILYVNNEYRFSSFAGVFPPVCIILGFLIFSSNLPQNFLAYGTLIGAILSSIYLLGIALKKKVISFGKINFKNDNIKLTFSQLPAKISSGFLASMIPVVDKFFAAQLIVGSIAALNYGVKIPAFLTNILLIAISNVLLPYFSKLIISDREKAFSMLFVNLKRVFIILLIISMVGIVFSEWVVELLFERKEFTSKNTETVALLQQILLVYIPFRITGLIMVNFLISINKNSFMAYVALVALILNIIFDYILMQMYGVFGIAICTTIITVLKSIVFYVYLKKVRTQGIDKQK